jgi:protein SCO1/2
MSGFEVPALKSETAFAAFVDELAADAVRRDALIDLLREDHPVYDQRGTATLVRMRGWILLALARTGVPDAALPFIIDELDTGVDPYLVAAAAYALRSYAQAMPAFAPFVMQAFANIRYRDDPVSLDEYGGYAVGADATSPVVELLRTLAWLGPNARAILTDLEPLGVSKGGLPGKRLTELHRAIAAIRATEPAGDHAGETCCTLESSVADMFRHVFSPRPATAAVESVVLEDQNGDSIRFDEFFVGQPSIVVFFYTRCDNPLKCSLTITKLARIQKALETQALADRIRTAAITYDPGFDLHERLRAYGANRGVRMDAQHRMLRPVDGIGALRAHFALGANFIESVVNRHRIEAYILDAKGRIAASFARIRWDEQEVVARAIEVLNEKDADTGRADEPVPPQTSIMGKATPPILATVASLAFAFFPKCPVCWAAYLSLFGIVALEQIPYAPWLLPLLALAVATNVVSVWLRARTSARFAGFYLVAAGACAIFASNLGMGGEVLAMFGVAATLTGSLLSAANLKRRSPEGSGVAAKSPARAPRAAI